MNNTRTQIWECALHLTQQGLLTVLTQVEAEVAMKKWPSITASEAQDI